MVIEGKEEEEVCGMLSCMVCQEKWGAAEDFANLCRDCGGTVEERAC